MRLLSIFLLFLFSLFTPIFASTLTLIDSFSLLDRQEQEFLAMLEREKREIKSVAPPPKVMLKKGRVVKKREESISKVSPIERVEEKPMEEDVDQRASLEAQLALAKEEERQIARDYALLQKELDSIEQERKRRKAFLEEIKEEVATTSQEMKSFDKNYQLNRQKREALFEKIAIEAQKRRHLASIKREKALRALQQEQKRHALIKRKKALEKLKRERLERQRREKLAKAKRAKEAKKAKIVAKVTLSKQRMKVFKDGKLLHTWRVSTAKRGHITPIGSFKPQLLKKMHYSSLYNNSPMPYTIFYDGNYAIHGTNYTRKLGRPASHGCVRLRTSNAKKLYALARKYGKENLSIKIVR
jgi:lipoprotein-anchoring transpeptidase ErfK/SrfK